MHKKSFVILIGIFILAAFLRFYQLGNIPVGFHRDEAFLGYNAYSILKTGRDMTGNFLPLHIQAFLYSPAGYAYASIPFIWAFGLSAFSVRFASALFGSLQIFATYIFVLYLFRNYRKREILALVSSLFMAVSPWNINLARTATDNVIVTFEITIGVLLYLLWVDEKRWWYFVLSFLLFLISLFTYQAPRSFLPLLLPVIFLLFLVKSHKRLITSFIGYGLVIVLPVILVLHSPVLSQRITMLSITQNPGDQLVLNEQIRENGVAGMSPFVTRVFHNKLITYSTTFMKNYASQFSYDFLFTDSGLPIRYKVPSMGLLYITDLPLLFIGIWALLRKQKKIAALLFFWIAFAPVGSALTIDDVPNLQRTLFIFPPLAIVIAYGAIALFELLEALVKQKYLLHMIQGILLLIFIYNIAFYLQQYYVHLELHRPWYRQEGYQQLVATVNKLSPQYKKVIISEAEQTPSIFFFFYNRIDPTYVQNLYKTRPTTDYGNISFGKYQFTQTSCPLTENKVLDTQTGLIQTVVKGEHNVLYVNDGVCNTPKEDAHILSTIKRPDGTPAFILLQYK